MANGAGFGTVNRLFGPAKGIKKELLRLIKLKMDYDISNVLDIKWLGDDADELLAQMKEDAMQAAETELTTPLHRGRSTR